MIIAIGIRQFPELKDRKCDNCENAATDVLVDMADEETPIGHSASRVTWPEN